MKTISANLNINNNGINQLITTKKLHKYYQIYDHASGDRNRNATITQVEYERDACEEELYRLRYGIENLLANYEKGEFKLQQENRFANLSNPFQTMRNKITDFNNRKNQSWLDQCSPCCRRWRRNRRDNNVNVSNEYNYRPVYNDRNQDISSPRTPVSPRKSQLYSDSFASASRSPSISSRYIDPNKNHSKISLKQNVNKLINRIKPSKTNISDQLIPKDLNNPAYNSLIVKILEAKALDCLCTGYSKKNTQKQIKEALTAINQRDGTSSPSINYQSSSPSSILTDNKSHSITPQKSNQKLISRSSSGIRQPNRTSSRLLSPGNNKQKTKSNIKSPRKRSKIPIAADKRSQSKKTKPSSKQRRTIKSRSKPIRKSTSTIEKRIKSKTSNKRPSSSRLKKQRSSSKSPSRNKIKKKLPSKNKGSVRRKKTKSKSNNQVNDHDIVILPKFIYSQTYQQIYRNRQNL